MWETIQSSAVWGGVGTGVAWVVTACLLIAGAIGCVLPVLPGHLILIFAAVGHRLMLGAEGSGLDWWSFVILGVLMAISQTLEMVSGAAGAKWFGGTRWGALGRSVGAIVGMFFMPFGLLVGPLVGAFVCEIGFAKKETRPRRDLRRRLGRGHPGRHGHQDRHRRGDDRVVLPGCVLGSR